MKNQEKEISNQKKMNVQKMNETIKTHKAAVETLQMKHNKTIESNAKELTSTTSEYETKMNDLNSKHENITKDMTLELMQLNMTLTTRDSEEATTTKKVNEEWSKKTKSSRSPIN